MFDWTGLIYGDAVNMEYRASLSIWVKGLAHEYFGLSVPSNIHEVEIEWFTEVELAA